MRRSFYSGSVAIYSGYTLVELMVAVGLFGIVMTSMVSTFMVFASGSKGVAAYTEMSRQSRKAIELFAQDVRAAEGVIAASLNDLRIRIPNSAFYSGGTVQYTYDTGIGIFSRIDRDTNGNVRSNEILLDGVDQFAFELFDPLGQVLDPSKESLLLSVKSVQMDAVMSRTVSQSEVTDYVISTRYMMRNRSVGE